jgi:hypothetical protein
MDIHKNARLTLRRREDLVEYAARGVTLKLAAGGWAPSPAGSITRIVRV